MSGTSDPKARHRLATRRSLRTQLITPIVAPAIALTSLWGYTAASLADQQIELQDEAERTATTGGRALKLVSSLQQERRLTAIWQRTHSSAARSALDQARTKTDAAIRDFRPVPLADTSGNEAVRSLTSSLDALASRREAIDTRTMSSEDAFLHLTKAIQSGTDLIASAVHSSDGALSQGGNATAALVRLTEMLSREDALLSAALPQGSFSTAAHQRFSHYVGAQREIRASLAQDDLPVGTRASYTQIAATTQASSVFSIEEAVVTAPATQLPPSTKAWKEDAATLVSALQGLAASSLDELAHAASDRATGLLVGLIAGTTLTGALLTAGAVLGLRTRRSTLDAVAELQLRTEEMARQWPQALAHAERGEPLTPSPQTPRRQAAGELQLLGSAIDRLRHTAIDTILTQSRGHAGAEKVLGQLSRRTQTLIHRLIALLDDLERKHGDSDLLKDIFKVDHLATRVRRHAENLVILGDTPPTRRMTEPVTITDVMRSAVAETEHYTRVKVENLPATKRLALAGRAVADVTHLLAELVENASNFSPPYTQVIVSALHVADGVALHVEDHGLGIPADQLAHANHILAHPQKPDMAALSADPRLGHFVVARLAQRHQIRVELRPSVYGGTLAIVFLPTHMLEELESPVMNQIRAAAQHSGGVLNTGADPQPNIAPSYATATNVVSTPAPHPHPLAGPPDFGGADWTHDEHAPVTDSQDISAGTTSPSWEPRSSVPDYSGFPTYGGAGLVSPHHPDMTDSLHGQHQPPLHETPQARPRKTTADRHTDTVPPTPATAEVPGTQNGERVNLRQPSMLPQRTRGSSLAVQLRRDAADVGSRIENDGEGPRSPEASARIVAAIRRGMDQATGTSIAPGTDARRAD
ncbi:nitrate- and nitrite sensing domain-containing protein [Streptomyces sp. NPDC056549]|uniref:sensor histidine kinase n=1 Tax=Streptomyces sp. NPDC056549 TaxID=3345864 RepID=UPI0036C326ED